MPYFMTKDWVDYRFEEMEEKAGLATTFPKYDMDGSRFVPDDDDWECDERNDAYINSISKRLTDFCLNLDPYGF